MSNESRLYAILFPKDADQKDNQGRLASVMIDSEKGVITIRLLPSTKKQGELSLGELVGIYVTICDEAEIANDLEDWSHLSILLGRSLNLIAELLDRVR